MSVEFKILEKLPCLFLSNLKNLEHWNHGSIVYLVRGRLEKLKSGCNRKTFPFLVFTFFKLV